MKLIGDFCKIEQLNEREDAFEYQLSLNKEHFIYQAHFPGNPVTPGVCIIQICKELMEQHTGKSLFIKKIQNVKFLSVINPVVMNTIQVSFSKIAEVEDGYTFSAFVHWKEVSFTKLSLYLQCQ